MRPIDSSSKTAINPISFEFPDSVLNKVKDITLADLLDNPATQCWLISAMSNACTHASVFVTDMSPKDSHNMVVIQSVINQIPNNERMELFRLTADLIHSRKNVRSN